ncbi:MAG: penicillin-binding protein 1C [Proteobacteria bacterium]|nr:penicillin-binding protein 1C [Pseudomonadota bacterium]MBU1715462.1 penicillin-binding protein 1C [Pseudomonadota bacterium]
MTLLILLALDRWYPGNLQPRSRARLVVDAAGHPLRSFADEEGVWRYETSAAQVSPLYLQALINYEDRWFYKHWGVNPLSLLRAAGQWLRSGKIVSGGSTLTMQIARIRYHLGSDIFGKLQQIMRALQLEFHFSKQEILTYYLNHAPFGGTLEGVEAASRSYFGYSAQNLTLAQAALLAVLPQAPSRYRPDRYPARAEQQRNKVLDRLVIFGSITPTAATDAKMESVAATTPRLAMVAPLLARRLKQTYPDSALISSFIDRDLQQRLEQIARDSVYLIPERASLAIMVMEHETGKVVGYVGSADMLDANRFGHVDMVVAKRSPGSTLKPFIYGLALDGGLIHSESLLMDVPLSFSDYRPHNFNGGFSGPVSVSRALKESLNIPAVQVLEQLGPGQFYARMQTAGAGLLLPPGAQPNLSLALGGVSTSLEHLVGLYSTLANGGEALKPRLTPDDPVQRTKLLSGGAAWIVRNLLYRPTDEADFIPDLAVKTGTSYGNRDAWALGVTDNHTLGVWVGSPDNAAMVGHFGNFTAIPILHTVVSVLPRTNHRAHPRPETVTSQSICWPGGRPTSTLCDEIHHSWILDQTIPQTMMSTVGQSPLIPTPELSLRISRDTGLRTTLGCLEDDLVRIIPIWPAPLQNWIKLAWRNKVRIPALDPRCNLNDGLLTESPVQIVGIQDHDRIKRHASTLAQPRLSVDAVGGQPNWYWFLNDELLTETGNHLNLLLPNPGEYQLSVSDQAGMSDSVRFVVEQEPFNLVNEVEKSL